MLISFYSSIKDKVQVGGVEEPPASQKSSLGCGEKHCHEQHRSVESNPLCICVLLTLSEGDHAKHIGNALLKQLCLFQCLEGNHHRRTCAHMPQLAPDSKAAMSRGEQPPAKV